MIKKVLEGRGLAFDYGERYIGVATGQTITRSATALTCIANRDQVPDWVEIQTLIEEWQPNFLVVGLPLNMDGSEQPLTHRARSFGNQLIKKFKLPLRYQDERLSTIEAKERLFAVGGSQSLKKVNVDAKAAEIILSDWLNS